MRKDDSPFGRGVLGPMQWFLTKHELAITDDSFGDWILQRIFRGRVLCLRSSEVELRFFFGQGFNVQARPPESRGWIPLQLLLPGLALASASKSQRDRPADGSLNGVLEFIDRNWSELVAALVRFGAAAS